MAVTLDLASDATQARWLRPRPGEVHLGERVLLPEADQVLAKTLSDARHQGARYALLGVPEDIGPRANCGRGGSDAGWDAFLDQFLNLQSNALLDGREILLLGQLHTADLQQLAEGLDPADAGQLTRLRQLTTELDRRLAPVIKAIVAAGLEPLVIGGGHNNAFPLLQGSSQALGRTMAAINLDPHADFRALEGRHSGNGFAYAWQAGALDWYAVVGLHEQKNNADALASMATLGIHWTSLQQIWIRRELALDVVLDNYLGQLGDRPLGLELDLDAIASMPSSAESRVGLPLLDACHWVYRLARHPNTRYLHLCEGAPACHPAGLAAGQRAVGQALAELVLSYLAGRRQVAEG